MSGLNGLSNRQFGFSVFQMLLVMSIMALLSAGVVPSFKSSIKNNRMDAAVIDLTAQLEFARSEAVKRNTTVTICASSDSSTCNTEDWALGRIVFIDDGAGTTANAANGEIDGETVLKVFDTSYPAISITPSSFSTSGYLTFSGDGAVNSNGTMVVCDDRTTSDATLIKAINLHIVGQIRRAYDSDATPDSIVNNVSGSNVSCS